MLCPVNSHSLPIVMLADGFMILCFDEREMMACKVLTPGRAVVMLELVQVFRATHGKASVWGKAPSFITAKYTPADGQEKTSLLLTSGMPSHTAQVHHVQSATA